MEAILEYVMANYTWFLGGAIIILLAIIGSYADKTNFGQGKNNEFINKNNESDETEQLENLDRPINEVINLHNNDINDLETSKQEKILDNNNVSEFEPTVNLNQITDTQIQAEENIVSDETKIGSGFEESFEIFDKEFNDLLPEKEVINNELLDEIENLSLDKTQKIALTDLPDLDDVELPKIKSLAPEEDEVWKF